MRNFDKQEERERNLNGQLTSKTEDAPSGSASQCRVPDILLAADGSRHGLREGKQAPNCGKRQAIVAHDPPRLPQRRQRDIPLHGRYVLPCRRDSAQNCARHEARPHRAGRLERDGVVLP